MGARGWRKRLSPLHTSNPFRNCRSSYKEKQNFHWLVFWQELLNLSIPLHNQSKAADLRYGFVKLNMDLDAMSCENLSLIVLKGEQKEATSALLRGEYLFAVLSTVKVWFTSYLLRRKENRVRPLTKFQSLLYLRLKVYCSTVNFERVWFFCSGKYHIVYMSAEQVLLEEFIELLNKDGCEFRRALSLSLSIVVEQMTACEFSSQNQNTYAQ